MYVLVLHRDLLPSARAVALEGLHLRREGATALVQDSRFGISASNPLRMADLPFASMSCSGGSSVVLPLRWVMQSGATSSYPSRSA
jgi:hypothetical protein